MTKKPRGAEIDTDRLVTVRLTIATLVCQLLLPACGQTRDDTPIETIVQNARTPVSLAINGFNYTDSVISYFTVGGQGGSNIYVSSPTSGGGGTSCCITWQPGTPLPRPIKVEWLRVVDGKDRSCERTAQLVGPVPDKPTALGVHFMPEGDIQIQITAGEADPLLRLERFNAGQGRKSGNFTYDKKTAKCRDER